METSKGHSSFNKKSLFRTQKSLKAIRLVFRLGFFAVSKTDLFVLKNAFSRVFVTLVLLLLVSQTSWSQVTKRFIPNSGSWNVANNWSPTGIPNSEDFIVFPGTVTAVSNVPNVGASSPIKTITIEGNAGVITFSGVSNNGVLNIREGFSVQSGRTLVLNLMTFLLDAGSSSFVAGTVELNSPGNSGNSAIEVNGEFILTNSGLVTQSRSGSFSINAGATLRIGSPNGINLVGNNTGNVQTSTRIFDTNANYIYIGVGNQTSGTALPLIVNKLEIINTGSVGNSTVSLFQNVTIQSDLIVSAGELNLAGFSANRSTLGGTLSVLDNARLRIGGNLTLPSNYTTHQIACTSTIEYAGASQTIANLNSGQIYGNLVLSGSNLKTLQTGIANICSNFSISGTASSTAVTGLTIGGAFTMGAGTAFNAASFAYKVAGNWSSFGNFNRSTSTVELNGANNIQALAGSTAFHNLLINHSGSGNVNATGSTLVVANMLNVQLGTFIASGNLNHLTIQNNAMLQSVASGTFNVTGSWLNSGNFLSSGGTVNFSGTAPQILGAGAPSAFTNLTINNPTGVTLGNAASSTATLNLSAGLFSLGNFNFAASNITGFSATRYIRTNGQGRLRRLLPFNSPRIFPIGNSAYNPVTLTNGNTTNDPFLLRVADGPNTLANNNEKLINRQWYIKKETAGIANVTASISYNPGEEGAAFNSSQSPLIGYYNGQYWEYASTNQVVGTTFTASGQIGDGELYPEGFLVLGSDDALKPTKLAVFLSPKNPLLGIPNRVTVQVQNSNNVATRVETATGFSVSASNTDFVSSPRLGTIAVGNHETTLENVVFSEANSEGNAFLTAVRTSGDILELGLSEQFEVISNRIFEPLASGNWDEVAWRVSFDGGSSWLPNLDQPTPISPPANNDFAEDDLIRVPVGIILNSNVSSSFYGMLIFGTLENVGTGDLTWNHASGIDSRFEVFGTLKNSGGILTNTDLAIPILFQGGTYHHDRSGGNIPIGVWESNEGILSTCILNGEDVAGLHQEFQNFTLASGVHTLRGNMGFRGLLTLISGRIITTPNFNVVVRITGEIAENPGGYVQGQFQLFPPAEGETIFFPVGDSISYAPIRINVFDFVGNTTNNGYLIVSTEAATPPVASGLSQTNFIKRKWRLLNNGVGAFSSFDLNMEYSDADTVGEIFPKLLKVRRFNNNIWYPTNGGVDSQDNNKVVVTGLISGGPVTFSDFYIGQDDCTSTNYVWLGGVSSNWHNPNNWCSGLVPNATTNVTIPGGISRSPIISSEASVRSLIILEGARVIVSNSNVLRIHGDLINTGEFLTNSGTVYLQGTENQIASGTSTLIFHNLIIDNAAGVKAGSNITVNNLINLVTKNSDRTLGTLEMVREYGNYSNMVTAAENLTTTYTQLHDILDSYILHLGATATVTGEGDVTGKIKRTTFLNNTAYSFGNRNDRLVFSNNETGTLPSEILFITTKGAVRGVHANMPQAVERLFQIIRKGGTTPTTFTLRLNYQDEELNDNEETPLVLWDHHIPYVSANTPHEHGKTIQSTVDNWVELSGHGILYLQTGEVIGGATKYWMIRETLLEGNIWLGAVNSNWNVEANWTGLIPKDIDNVIIPSLEISPRSPILPAATETSPGAVIRSLTIEDGGVVNGGKGTLSLKGGISNFGGVGSWVNNGAFISDSSLVIFDFPRVANLETSSVAGMGNFYNVSVRQGSYFRPQLGSEIKISGTFINEGVVDATTFNNVFEYNGNNTQLLISPNGAIPGYSNLILSGMGDKVYPPQFNIRGNFINNSTATIHSDFSTVLFNGNVTQYMVGNDTIANGPFPFYNLSINNPEGVIAEENIDVNNILNIQSVNPSATKGALDLVNKMLFLKSNTTGSVLGVGDVSGLVKRSGIFNDTDFIPFTNTNQGFRFRDLAIDQEANPKSLFVRSHLGTALDTVDCGSIENPINRYYSVWKQGAWGSVAKATIRVKYLPSEIPEGINFNNLTVWQKTATENCEITELGKANQSLLLNYVSVSELALDEFPEMEGELKFTLAPTAAEMLIWTGDLSTDMNDAGNWEPTITPSNLYSLYIPGTNLTPRDPVLPAGTLTVKAIELEDGAILNTDENSGTLKLVGSGSVFADGAAAEFNSGNSTVLIATDQVGVTATLTGDIHFNNLTIAEGSRVAPAGGSYLKISGTLTNDGVFDTNLNENTIEYAGINQLMPPSSSNGILAEYRNLVISGTGTQMPSTVSLRGDFIYDGSGLGSIETSITFTGETAQNVGGNSQAQFENLIVDNPDRLTLNQNLQVLKNLTFLEGKIFTGTNDLLVGSAENIGTIVDADGSKHVVGNLSRYVYNLDNLSLDFPVGDLTTFAPMTVNFSVAAGGSGYLRASTRAIFPDLGYMPDGAGLSEDKYIDRRWSLENFGVDGFMDYGLVMNFSTNDIIGDINLSALTIRRLEGAQWSAVETGASTATSIEAIALQGFGEFAVGEGCTNDFTWLGINSNWFDPINWCGGQVPPILGTSQPVILPPTDHDPIIDKSAAGGGDVMITGNLFINFPTQLLVKSGTSFILATTSNLDSEAGTLIEIEDGALYKNLGRGVPILKVHQTLNGHKGWRMLGAPLLTTFGDLFSGMVTQGFSGSDFPLLQPNIIWWDETNKGTSLQGWRQPIDITSEILPGRGYYVYAFDGASMPGGLGNYGDNLPVHLSPSGFERNLFNSGFIFDVTFNQRDTSLLAIGDSSLVEINVGDEGFNLLANPTPSTIDYFAESSWTKTNMDEAIYVWDPNFNAGQGAFRISNGIVGNIDSGLLSPFQAFWVRANNLGPSLILNNSGKSAIPTAIYGRKLTEQEPRNIKLNLWGDGMQVDSYISFSENGKEGFDPYDAYQLESLSDNWLMLYTYGSLRAKSPLIINTLPALDEQERSIPLHIASSKGGVALTGKYNLQWELPSDWPREVSIVLMDHIRELAIDMTQQNRYDFSFKAPNVVGQSQSRLDNGLRLPQAVVFQSPYEAGEPNMRVDKSSPKRPFTIMVGGEYRGGIIEYKPDIPKLFVPFPNPFQSKVNISFFLPIEGEAEIRILDVQGRERAHFPLEKYPTGTHKLVWEGQDFPDGLYIIQLLSDGKMFTQKLIKN